VTLTQSVERLKARGQTNREIARRLGIDEKAVRKRLRRIEWKDMYAGRSLRKEFYARSPGGSE